MRLIFIALTLLVSTSIFAQTAIDKTFQVQAAKELVVELDHPNAVIQTWDRNDISIKGTVSINHGENDANFELQSTNDGGILRIKSFIKDKENLPKYTTVKKGEKEYIFKKGMNDPELRKFLEENGNEYNYMTNGISIDVNLQIFVPKNFQTTIDAKHGVIEFKQFEAPLRIEAKHGKIDAVIPATLSEIVARTQYGEIMSNLDIKIDQRPFEPKSKNKWTEVTAHPGKGYAYWLESKHGKIYLRKP